jgi:flagellar biosynthetic protein FliR
MTISLYDQTMLVAFWLCFSRWLAIVFQLPIFDNVAIPPMVKILSSLILAYAFFPLVQSPIIAEVKANPDSFFILTFTHTLIGLVIGFLVKSIMAVFSASGNLMTQQIGFSSMTFFDPTFEQQVGPFEKIIQWTMLILILSSGALLPMFKGVVNSFHSINLLKLTQISFASQYYMDFFKSLFIAAIMLASPILFTNFIINIILGVIARTVPQMNILMVSFAVNIGLGLMVFTVTSNDFFNEAYNFYVTKLGEWFEVLL